jgi:hypothetical protein
MRNFAGAIDDLRARWGLHSIGRAHACDTIALGYDGHAGWAGLPVASITVTRWIASD